MIFQETNVADAYVIDIEKREDERGFFARGWCQKEFEAQGIVSQMVQMNIAYNNFRGILRGLHYQVAPFAEAKLVRCTKGSIFDVVADIRPASPSYRKWVGVELTEDNYRMLLVPEGCAHGYLVLRDKTEVCYQVSQYYTPESERGIRWDDPALGIDWPLKDNLLITEKDRNWLNFTGYES